MRRAALTLAVLAIFPTLSTSVFAQAPDAEEPSSDGADQAPPSGDSSAAQAAGSEDTSGSEEGAVATSSTTDEPAAAEAAEGGGEDDFGFDDETTSGGNDGADAGVAERPSALDLKLQIGALGRSLHYVDTAEDLGVTSAAGTDDHYLDATLAGQIAGHWYPLAHFMSGALSHLGVGFSYGLALPQDSEFPTADGSGTEKYKSYYQAYSAGLHYRIPISWLTLGVAANYGSQALWVRTSSDNADPQKFPDTEYSYVEGVLDAKVQVNHLSLSGHIGYLYALSTGEISDADWFENAKAMALSYGGEVAYRVAPAWEVISGVDAVSYSLNFNPIDAVAAPRVAGGASDRYLSFWAGARFTLPGSSPKTNAGSEGPAAKEGGAGETDDFDSFDSFD